MDLDSYEEVEVKRQPRPPSGPSATVSGRTGPKKSSGRVERKIQAEVVKKGKGAKGGKSSRRKGDKDDPPTKDNNYHGRRMSDVLRGGEAYVDEEFIDDLLYTEQHFEEEKVIFDFSVLCDYVMCLET